MKDLGRHGEYACSESASFQPKMEWDIKHVLPLTRACSALAAAEGKGPGARSTCVSCLGLPPQLCFCCFPSQKALPLSCLYSDLTLLQNSPQLSRSCSRPPWLLRPPHPPSPQHLFPPGLSQILPGGSHNPLVITLVRVLQRSRTNRSIYLQSETEEREKDIYFKELVHMNVERQAQKLQGRPAGWGRSKEF